MIDFKKVMEDIRNGKKVAISIMSYLRFHVYGTLEQDDEFLKQFGIQRLTPIRKGVDGHHDTEFDEAAEMHGLVRHDHQDEFIVEKDGVQVLVYLDGGVWMTGNVAYVKKACELVSVSETEL